MLCLICYSTTQQAEHAIVYHAIPYFEFEKRHSRPQNFLHATIELLPYSSGKLGQQKPRLLPCHWTWVYMYTRVCVYIVPAHMIVSTRTYKCYVYINVVYMFMCEIVSTSACAIWVPGRTSICTPAASVYQSIHTHSHSYLLSPSGSPLRWTGPCWIRERTEPNRCPSIWGLFQRHRTQNWSASRLRW